MKILLLYSETIPVWPLLQTIPLLEERGIYINAHLEDEEFNINEFNPKSYDAVLIQQSLISDEVFKASGDRPVIIYDRIDGCQLAAARKWIDRAAGIFKSYTFRDPSLHNKYRGRAFIEGLGKQTKKSAGQSGTPKEISDKDLEKIHVIYGFGAYERLASIVPAPLDNDRSIPVNFMGTIEYNGTEVQEHRLDACRAIESIYGGEVSYGRNVPFNQYIKVMIHSKSVLCPYGLGEATHRDYEAALLGCLLIRPNIIDILSFPDFYIPEVTFFPCNSDFSDVEEIVNYILLNWDGFEDIRKRVQELAASCRNFVDIADRFQKLLEKIV